MPVTKQVNKHSNFQNGVWPFFNYFEILYLYFNVQYCVSALLSAQLLTNRIKQCTCRQGGALWTKQRQCTYLHWNYGWLICNEIMGDLFLSKLGVTFLYWNYRWLICIETMGGLFVLKLWVTYLYWNYGWLNCMEIMGDICIEIVGDICMKAKPRPRDCRWVEDALIQIVCSWHLISFVPCHVMHWSKFLIRDLSLVWRSLWRTPSVLRCIGLLMPATISRDQPALGGW